MAKINTAYTFYVGLASQADTKLFQANPTLAAGDVKISIDGGAFANITSLPTISPAAGRQVKVALTAAEMNGNFIAVQFVDAAGAEWCDFLYEIETSPDDLTIAGIASAVSVVAPTATENADALLNRDLSLVTVTNSRSPINALRFNRNKFTIDHGTGALTVYEEDDTTVAWTGTITPTASIVTLNIDPA